MSPVRTNFTRSLPRLMALACSGLLPVVAISQQTEQPAIQEIIVTAMKRSENIQAVPFSVSATNQQQIVNSGADNIVELARTIPGLAIADLGPGQSQMAIRGISSGQVIRDQPGVKEQVGVYLDESPISVALFTPDLELYDLDRFEVLKGPQGTLFGAGSEAGTVRYITRQPQLGKSEVLMDAALEDVTHGDQGGYLRTALNAPMSDTVALRLVAYWHHLPGFIDAITPVGSIGADKPSAFTVQHAINDGDRGGARLSLLIKPNDSLSITPRVMFQQLQTNGYPRVDLYNILANPYTTTQPPVTIADRQQYRQQHDGLTDDFTLSDLTIAWDTGPGTLTSVSSYTHRNVLVLRDATQLTGSVTYDVLGDVSTPTNPAGVRTNSPLFDRTHLNVFSQELRLASNGRQTIDWLIGGFFQHVERRYGQDLPTPGYDALNASTGAWPGCPKAHPVCNFPFGPNDPLAPADTPFFSDLSYKLKQYAAFTEETWHATDQFGITAGLRYYKFTEDRVLNFHGVFAADTPAGGVPASTDSSGVSPRAILSWSPATDLTFNAQAARGFRLGGINDPLNKPLCSPIDLQVFGSQANWKDETAWNYELGMKSQWLDHRVTFNITGFYEDIKDLQATTTAGTCSSRIVFNVPTARSTGVEAELFAHPTINWDFGVSATYVDAKLTSSVTSSIPPPAGSPPGTPSTVVVVGGLADGNRLPTAPKTQAVGTVTYTLPLQASKTDFFTNLTVTYVGSSFSQFENEQPGWGQIGDTKTDPYAARLITYGGPLTTGVINFNPELPSSTLANLRLGLKTDRWQVAAYCDNLADKTARLALDYERGRSARVGYLTNPPRTYGVYGAYSF